MAKGQSRQTREIRKPKKDAKVKAAAKLEQNSVTSTFAAPKSGKR